MKTFAVRADRTIRLPRGLFKPADKVAIFVEGDMLIIKRLEPPRLSSIAERVREPAVPLRTIVKEVRAHRRAHRGR